MSQTALLQMVPAVLLLMMVGLVLGLVVGIAAKLFAVAHDPRLEEAEELLPGANCGACGLAGCADFARALLAGDATPDLCPSTSAESAAGLAALLGVELGERTREVAVVRCAGGNSKTKAAPEYNGVNDCKSASLVANGAKGCQYGCLGLASCARACPFDAIEITADGLAVVDPEVCTGCAKCVASCPRNLIILAPRTAAVHVLCNSPEKGSVTTKVCDASCIGCRKCVKASEPGQITMEGFLARINYDNPPDVAVVHACPTGCIHTAPGVPRPPKPEPEAKGDAAHG